MSHECNFISRIHKPRVYSSGGITLYHFEQEVKDSKTAAGSKSNTKSLARAPDGI